MKKEMIIRLAIVLMGFMLIPFCEVSAKQYRIIHLWNCKSIKIGVKKLKIGDTFQEGLTIHWTNAKQLMEVQETTSGRRFKIAQKSFEKYKAKSIWDYITSENSAGHRSFSNGKYYTEGQYFLGDSLHFATMDPADPNTISEAIWDCNGEHIITSINRTDDGLFYIITPAIFGNKKPRDIFLNIREREDGLDWINNVYQDIPITFIPIK